MNFAVLLGLLVLAIMVTATPRRRYRHQDEKIGQANDAAFKLKADEDIKEAPEGGVKSHNKSIQKERKKKNLMFSSREKKMQMTEAKWTWGDNRIDDCTPNPCKHGTCQPGIWDSIKSDFICKCDSGWEGRKCDQNIDDCASNPCRYGWCWDKLNDFKCRCVDGWKGKLCDQGPGTVDIRLAGGNSTAGRVEVLYEGQWGTVCDDHWGMDDARVVCRWLDLGEPAAFTRKASFGEGTGPILLDNVACLGNETNIGDCRHRGFNVSNCEHDEDAGVVCSGTEPQDCYWEDGRSYRGRKATTRDGVKCQAWSSQYPHGHGQTSDRYPGSDLQSNYCRNPNGASQPWCYTTDIQNERDSCDIPECEGQNIVRDYMCGYEGELCKNGWSYGCWRGSCWTQCNSLITGMSKVADIASEFTQTWGAIGGKWAREWCYSKGDDGEKIQCETNYDCDWKMVYRKKCKGACTK